MRRHGVQSFPDPIVTDKPPYELNLNPADYSEVSAHDRVELPAVGLSDRR
jgi:hypothetical protein